MKSITVIEPDKLYTMNEVADALGVTRATVLTWKKNGLNFRPMNGLTRPHYVWGNEVTEFFENAMS